MAPSDILDIIKLTRLCIGDFENIPEKHIGSETSPKSTDIFMTLRSDSLDEAVDRVRSNEDIDLIFLDIDDYDLFELVMFVSRIRDIRPELPILVFSKGEDEMNDKAQQVLREGASWHYRKTRENLVDDIKKHVFSETEWDKIFTNYKTMQPIIGRGMGQRNDDAWPEERYIIKRLFAGNDVVQIFQINEGHSGSKIYTVRAEYQLKRILKIDSADRMRTIRQKQEQLVQPKLDRRIGQIFGKEVIARHYGGACFTLAGSDEDTITLDRFLLDQNQVVKESVDKFFEQLKESLGNLYAGRRATELRYWACLFSRVLPPYLTLEKATLIPHGEKSELSLSLEDLPHFVNIPENNVLKEICEDVRNGNNPEMSLHNFVLSELDLEKGIIYLHDNLNFEAPFAKGVTAKDNPVLRFKVILGESDRKKLSGQIFRNGKRISVKGCVTSTQETIFKNNMDEVAAEGKYSESNIFEIYEGKFVAPLDNIKYLLWEVGREDIIIPPPQVSPVVHGDLNTGNILVELGAGISVWLIDFTEAKPGHIYFDLAKLEVEFRTHVFFDIFNTVYNGSILSETEIAKFILLIEEALFLHDDDFVIFVEELKNYHAEWYSKVNNIFPSYFEMLLYFLFHLRKTAKSFGPESFENHYPVALFFHSISALKYANLNDSPWNPWSKRLAFYCSLVSGRKALDATNNKSPRVNNVYEELKEKSSFAIVRVGKGGSRKYLVQYNEHWKMYNFVGGKMGKDDQDIAAKTLTRELDEELGINVDIDYKIINMKGPIEKRQFSRRQDVFKDYRFYLFEVEFLPIHPSNEKEFYRFADAAFETDRENILVSLDEIQNQKTTSNEPISDTVEMLLREIGEITEESHYYFRMDFRMITEEVFVKQGKAELRGYLINPYGKSVRDIRLEIQPSELYGVDEKIIQIDYLKAGARKEIFFSVSTKANQASLKIKVSYVQYPHETGIHQNFERIVNFVYPIPNPYVIGTPIMNESESMFFGRDDIFAYVANWLKTRKKALAFYGKQRVGKTSVLHQIARGKVAKQIREDRAQPIFPVFIDILRTAGRNTNDFFEFLKRTISKELKRNYSEFPKKMENPYGDFDNFIDNLMNELPENGILLLMMDEFDQIRDSIESGVLNRDILRYLNSLMKSRDRLRFVLAGIPRLDDMDEYFSKPFFAISENREVKSLYKEDMIKLVRNPVANKVEYDDEVVEGIWKATRGYPHFVQYICHEIIVRLNNECRTERKVAIEDYFTVIRSVIDEDYHFSFLVEGCTNEEMVVLSSLAKEMDSSGEYILKPNESLIEKLSLAICQSGFPITEEIVRNVLGKMEKNYLVTRSEKTVNEYRFDFDLLRQWISKRYPLHSFNNEIL